MAGPASRNARETAPTSPRLAIGAAEADLGRGTVRAPDGTVTELRRQSADVLRVLAARRGETVDKDALHAAVWGDIAVTDDSLVQCIGDIRRALGPARDALRTVPREGYRLEAGPPPSPPPLPKRPRRTLVAAMATIALLAGVLAWWTGTATSPPPKAQGPVAAVLPFANGGGGARWDRLAAGLTDEMIADLGGDREQAEAAMAEVRRIAPDFSLAFYLDGWPYEPGFRARLHDGAVRAGLGPAR